MSPLKAMSLRWVVWHDKFKTFDNLYFIDADILYMREPVSLHEQHLRHMKFIKDEGISNIVRRHSLFRNVFSKSYLGYLLGNYRNGGVLSVLQYFTRKTVYRMSGIHFVKVKDYYNKIIPELLVKYKQIIYTGKITYNTKFADNEALLYNMIKESGWDMSHFAIQRTSTSMFGFNEPEKQEFCPHHGIHLGIFRHEVNKISPFAIPQLDSDDYKYYIQQFQEEILLDSLFQEIYKMQPQNIKIYFKRMCQYYNIKTDLI
jgi:hypothetical protein